MHRLQIDGRGLGNGEPCFIIAELGVNHNGEKDLAQKMIEMAASAGASAVKFQSFLAEEIVGDPNLEYQYLSQGRVVKETQLQMFHRLELPSSWLGELFDHARSLGLVPFSTPADAETVDLLEKLDVGVYKIGSDDLTNLPLLEYVARKGRPIILSTGMAILSDVEQAIATVTACKNDQIVLLHCVSLYPAPPEEVHLRRILTLRQAFQRPVGFSDHTSGIAAATAAVALGAVAVEKHITLDHNLPGPDHHFSADPTELSALTASIRAVEQALGSPVLAPTPKEFEMRQACRRSVTAAVLIPRGTRILREMLALKRPGTGLPPKFLPILIGRVAKTDIKANQQLTWEMV